MEDLCLTIDAVYEFPIPMQTHYNCYIETLNGYSTGYSVRILACNTLCP